MSNTTGQPRLPSMSFLYNLSLQKKISFFVLAGLGVTLGLFSWIGVRAAQQSTDLMLQERLNNARLVADSMDALLLNAVHDLRELSMQTDINSAQEAAPRIARLKQDFSETGLKIHDVFVLDDWGKVVWEDSPGVLEQVEPLPEMKLVFGDSYYYVSDSFNNGPAGGAPMVLLAVRRPSDGTSRTAVLGTLVDAMQWGSEGFPKPVSIGKNGYAEILDGKGTVLSRSSPGLTPRANEVIDHPGKFSDLIHDGRSVVMTCHNCHVNENAPPHGADIIAFAPLSITSWGVGLRQPEAEALSPVRDLEKQLLFFAGLLAVTGVILVGALTRSVVRPIRTLTLASSKISGGDLDGAIVSKSHDEIGQLSHAFDVMRVKLKNTQQVLEEWNRGLEERVRQRTAEISYQLEIAKILGSTLEIDPLLQKVMLKLAEFIRPVRGAAYLLLENPGNKTLVTRATAGQAINFADLEAPFKNIAEEAFNTGHTQYNPNLDTNPTAGALSDKTIASCLGVPILASSRAVGVLLVIGRKNLGRVGPPEIRLIEATAQQLGLALENVRLHGKVEEMAILQERDRMAREIHDGLAQTMAFLNLQIGTIRDQVASGDSGRIRKELDKMAEVTAEAYDEVREIIVGLDSEARLAQRVSDMGLLPVLKQVVGQFTEKSGIPAELLLGKDGPGPMPFSVQVQLVRVAQEALNNVRKHAFATKAEVQLEEREDRLLLKIIDNGLGFDPGSPKKEKHLGMGIMKSRVESLNGTFEIESAAGAGTKILVSLPLNYIRIPER